MYTLTLEIEYPDERTAKAVLSATSPDNDGYVEAEVTGSTLVLKSSSERAGTLRNTADDLLACIKVAEEAVADLDRDRFIPRPGNRNGP